MAKEITSKPKKINVLAQKVGSKEITQKQGVLPLGIEKDVAFGEIGMGVLSDGTPYLNQRGLAAICGVQNAHIGSISAQWNEADQKPRIAAIEDSRWADGYRHWRLMPRAENRIIEPGSKRDKKK